MNSYLFLAAGIVLMLVHHHADYLYQASLFRWRTWLDLDRTGPKWGFWDFIPHDSWHIVQSLRNHCGVIGAVLLTLSLPEMSFWLTGVAGFGLVMATYAVTRAIAFTLVYELMN